MEAADAYGPTSERSFTLVGFGGSDPHSLADLWFDVNIFQLLNTVWSYCLL